MNDSRGWIPMTSAPPLRPEPGASVAANRSENFFLYVEGPLDAEILRSWARCMSPRLARDLEQRLVILGGRRPARAVEHIRAENGAGRRGRGLVVLDRDHHVESSPPTLSESSLEVFTWGRRHIESYVLVPSAIARILGPQVDAARFSRLMANHLPFLEDEEACRQVDAKRLLGRNGPLARESGIVISPAVIARTMRAEEFHEDVRDLYHRIEAALGRVTPALEVVRRGRRN
ncbi:MAG: hypothetical protein VX252_07560 [Myxococcota bacterium]|nr:hypothetical protein [Myxococcota bacterium]